MKDQVSSIMSTLQSVKRETAMIADRIGTLEHTDMGMKNYINKVKKLSMQSLDCLNEMSRQLSFLTNESKNYEIRERQRKEREIKDTAYKNRRRQHALYS